MGFSAPPRVPLMCDSPLGYCGNAASSLEISSPVATLPNPFADVYLNLNPFIKNHRLIGATECSVALKRACLEE